MAYPIHMQATSADGTQLRSVHLMHAPIDAIKITKIRESLVRDGWCGRPVLLADCGDYHRAFTGTHRLSAAIGMDDVVEAVYLPDDLTAEQWDAIDAANDEDELLSALEAITMERDDLGDAIAVISAEIESNNS
jgi:hypothetical protein